VIQNSDLKLYMTAEIATGCKRKAHLPSQYWDSCGISVSS